MSDHRAMLEMHSLQQRLEEDHGGHTVKPGPRGWLRRELEHPDADYGVGSPDRLNRRNGYRTREWDARAGTVELTIPKRRQGGGPSPRAAKT